MKILFFIDSLKSGGAERVVSRLAEHWREKGYEIVIATTLLPDTDFYKVEGAKRIASGLTNPTFSIFETVMMNARRAVFCYRTMRNEKPDIVLSFMTNMALFSLVANKFARLPLLISERQNPEKQNISRLFRMLRRILYPFAEKIVFVSQGVADAYPWINPQKKAVIWNPASPLPLAKGGSSTSRTLLSIGRLVPAKGHDMLLEAFATLQNKYPEWILRIAGDGKRREELKQHAFDLGLAGKVVFLGTVETIPQEIHDADLFVLSSRYEGFPNALVEAMSAGVASISFDCPHGPAEIITHEKTGLLVAAEDTPALARAMDSLMRNDAKRNALGTAGRLSIQETLSIPHIAQQWEELMHTLKKFNRSKKTTHNEKTR